MTGMGLKWCVVNLTNQNMTRSIIVALLILLTISCKRETEKILTSNCSARQDYAKEPNEAARKVLGTWRLFSVTTGLVRPPVVPNQLLTFKADGTCVMIRDGKAYPPYPFLINTGELPGYHGVPVPLPQLVVTDNSQLDVQFLRLGKSILFVCDEEMILDYGTAVDGPSAIYRRESK